jgi:CheY-like chemotaxis protein
MAWILRIQAARVVDSEIARAADEVSIVLQQESQPPFRILYVEDNDLVREITCELLTSDALEVVAVGSGEEALVAFKDDRFDIVLTDVSLPAMSGIDLAKQIRQLAPSMPVILASGYPLDLQDTQFGAKVRAISKPFNALQLDELIQELCSNRVPAGPFSVNMH